jgi:hypothetical protein
MFMASLTPDLHRKLHTNPLLKELLKLLTIMLQLLDQWGSTFGLNSCSCTINVIGCEQRPSRECGNHVSEMDIPALITPCTYCCGSFLDLVALRAIAPA